MKSKHTPGPWKAMQCGETILIEASGLLVCKINPYGDYNKGIPKYIDKKNAMLIAAAPDLLAACEQAARLQCLNSDFSTDEEIHIADLLTTAIRKAKGE